MRTKFLQQFSSAILGMLLITSCNSSTTPPSFDSDPYVQNYDFCRNTTLKLNKPDAQSFRSLLTCLSGPEKVLLEYENLLNQINDEDLNLFLKLFSTNLEPRLIQVLDLLSRMERRELLRPFYQALSNLVESGQLLSFLKLYLNIHTDKNGDYEVNSIELENKLAQSLHEDNIDSIIHLVANLTSNDSAFKVAKKLSDSSLISILPSDLMTSRMLSLLQSAIQDKSFRTLLLALGDKELMRGYKTLTAVNKNQMGLLFSYVSKNTTFSTNPVFEDFVTLYHTASKPLKCFEDNNKVETVEKLTVSIGSEIAALKDQREKLNDYILSTTPVLLGISMGHCDVDKTLGSKAQVLWDSTQKGYGEGIASFIQIFAHPNRHDYKELFIKNPLTRDLLFVWEALDVKESGVHMLDMLSSVSEEQIEALSQLLLRVTSQNLTANQVPGWLKIHFKDQELIQLNKTFEQLADKEKSLFGLVKKLNSESQGSLSAKLRLQIAKDSIFTWDEEMDQLYQRMIKMMSSEKLPYWQNFTSTLLKSWKLDSGWGNIFLTFAKATGLSKEKPVQEWLALTLQDQENLNKAFPILIDLSKQTEFEGAINLTGELAKSGDLERLVRFMIEIFKSQKSDGGLKSGEQYSYELPKDESSYTAPITQPTPVKTDYSSCLKIHGDLFQKGGANFDRFLKCLDVGENSSGIFTKISDILRDGNLLGRLSKLISDSFFKGDKGQLFVLDLKLLVTSGDLDKTINIFKRIRNFDQSLSGILDKLVLNLVQSVRGNQAFEAIGLLLNHPQYVGAVNSLINLLQSDTVTKQFESDPNYKMPLPDMQVLYQMAKKRWPEVSYQQAVVQANKFSERGDAYYYDRNIYQKLTDDELKEDVLRVLSLLLRYDDKKKTGDLEEFLKAIKDLAAWHNSKDLDIASFLAWASSDYRAIIHYDPSTLTSEVRYVVPLDQLDLLVLNADFSVPIPVVGTDHLGTYFQLEIAKSTDLKKTLKKLRDKLEWGVWIGEKGLVSKSTYYKFLNNLENFFVLEQMNELGYLPLLQRLYQSLYFSTPDKYKDKEDPVKNHISLIHQPTRWGFFSRLAIGLRHLEEKQKLRPLIDSLLYIVSSLDESDYPLFREALHKLLYHDNDHSSFSLFIDWIFKLDTELSSQLKDLLFHLMIATPKVTEKGNAIAEVLIELGEKPQKMVELLKYITSDLSSDEKSSSMPVATYLAAQNDLDDLKKVITSLMKKDSNGLSPGGALLSTILHVATASSAESLRADLVKLSGMDVLKEKQSIEVIGNILLRYSGFRKILSSMLLDEHYRKDAMDILEAISKEGLFTHLLDELTDAESSQNIATLVRFVEKYISSSPTRP